MCSMLPVLFDWEYSLVKRHPQLYQNGSFTYWFFSLGTRKLAEYVNERRYDTVICTHVFPIIQITEARKYCTRPIQTAFIATDYTCSPLAEAGMLDYYFIPDTRLIDEFVNRGIERERIQVSGIPINRNYYIPSDNTIDDGKKRVLIMGGSLGCAGMEKAVKTLSKAADKGIEIYVVCGTNKRMKKRLVRLYCLDERIYIYGYTENIWELLSDADVFLTKPGGLSTSEAKAKGVPMVLLDMLGACEKYNADFFSKIDGAVSCKNAAEASDVCLHLLKDDSKREKMRNNLINRKQVLPTEYIVSALMNN